jgi:hypothetical protein
MNSNFYPFRVFYVRAGIDAPVLPCCLINPLVEVVRYAARPVQT